MADAGCNKLLLAKKTENSREEIVRELAFHVMVERGLADSDAARVVSNDEMARRIASIANKYVSRRNRMQSRHRRRILHATKTFNAVFPMRQVAVRAVAAIA